MWYGIPYWCTSETGRISLEGSCGCLERFLVFLWRFDEQPAVCNDLFLQIVNIPTLNVKETHNKDNNQVEAYCPEGKRE